MLGVARVRSNLGGVLTHMGKFEEAERHTRLAAVDWAANACSACRRR